MSKLTFEQILDQLSKDSGHIDFETFERCESSGYTVRLMKEAAELYAIGLVKEIEEEKIKYKTLVKEIDSILTMTVNFGEKAIAKTKGDPTYTLAWILKEKIAKSLNPF